MILEQRQDVHEGAKQTGGRRAFQPEGTTVSAKALRQGPLQEHRGGERVIEVRELMGPGHIRLSRTSTITLAESGHWRVLSTRGTDRF